MSFSYEVKNELEKLVINNDGTLTEEQITACLIGAQSVMLLGKLEEQIHEMNRRMSEMEWAIRDTMEVKTDISIFKQADDREFD